jgi:CubicO group peptidase (beta-lactamase class C family)
MNTNKSIVTILAIVLTLTALSGCGYSQEELDAVDYTPEVREDWEVSTPQEEGLDPMLVAQLYLDAQNVETINSLLVIKDGKLIAEKYFHEGAIDLEQKTQSVTKSFTSALVGIAIDQGYIEGVDQKMMDFFPELVNQIKDSRKYDITIEHLLQMRAGYPWEESSAELFGLLYTGFRPSNVVEVPLIRDPGSDYDYSNLSSHFLAIIVARATDSDLKDFAQENLFTPLGITVDEWTYDWEYYRIGHGEIYMTSREMAKLGELYLNGGVYNGVQIVSAQWAADSLKSYTDNAWKYKVGKNFNDIGYGYQWWSARAGDIRYNLAWGHGGQQIVVVDEWDLVIVVTAEPHFAEHGGEAWKHEKENVNLIADFIASLPSE